MTRPNKKAGAPREIRTPALPRFSAYLLTLQLPLRFVYYAFFRCFLCPRSSFRLGCLFRFCFAAPLGLVLYVDLLAPYVLLDDLLVLDDVLADPYLTGFTFTCTGPKLFFGPLYPKLLLVTKVFSIRFPSACSLVVTLHVYLPFLLACGATSRFLFLARGSRPLVGLLYELPKVFFMPFSASLLLLRTPLVLSEFWVFAYLLSRAAVASSPSTQT